uniref:TIDP2935 n=1 Tax=Arundo donax TaxID=35708 RepID=A0A0A9G930_ARUDO
MLLKLMLTVTAFQRNGYFITAGARSPVKSMERKLNS